MYWRLTANNISFADKVKLAWFILTNNKFTASGPQQEQFQNDFASWLGSKYATYVANGSVANFVLLDAAAARYGLNRGDKIVVPACTWVAGVNPIIQLGYKPIFCDVDLGNYGLDLEHLERISKEHDIKAVFPAHLLGLPMDVRAIKKILPQAIILEDVCESLGARNFDGSRVGVLGHGSTFSFYYSHHITTVEGGMVCTNDQYLDWIVKSKVQHGYAQDNNMGNHYKKLYPHEAPFLFISDGYNFKNTEIGAKLGLLQLARLDNIIRQRQENYTKFIGVLMNYRDKFYVPDVRGNSSFCFPILCTPNKMGYIHGLRNQLKTNGIEYRPIVAGNLLRQPYLKHYRDQFSCPNADHVHDNGVYIGNHHELTDNHFQILNKILWRVLKG